MTDEEFAALPLSRVANTWPESDIQRIRTALENLATGLGKSDDRRLRAIGDKLRADLGLAPALYLHCGSMAAIGMSVKIVGTNERGTIRSLDLTKSIVYASFPTRPYYAVLECKPQDLEANQ